MDPGKPEENFMENSEFALEIKQLSKSYATVQAVNQISFELNHGEIFGLLGPNGAGKTTIIRMILDIIKPDSGQISILNGPMNEAKKKHIGYLPEERGLYEDMTLWDTLLFLSQLKGLSRQAAESRAEKYLRKVELWDVRAQKIEALSRGMNQKAQFVAATMHEPELIIIDEPFAGLDPVNTRIIKSLLYEMRKRGAAIIMSTHQMHQVEEMCERILLIDRGQRVLYGRVDEIQRDFAGNAVEVNMHGEIDQVPGVERITMRDGNYRLLLKENVPPAEVLKSLVEMPGVTVERFEHVHASLEEIFIRVVEREVGSEELAG
jgi:ABC-2 type transport system ATP-binding protein